jgi:hypothetical protein
MNIKQFLKPDWKKIVIFLALFLIEFYFFYQIEGGWCSAKLYGSKYNFTEGKLTIEEPCDIRLDKHYSVPWNPCIIYCGNPGALTSFLIEFYYPLLFIIISVISYLTTCFIIWYYNLKKIILTVILFLFVAVLSFILFNYIPFLDPNNILYCPFYELNSSLNILHAIWAIINFPMFLFCFLIGGITTLWVIFWIISFSWFYILSCLIVWIYDKFRKRK